MDPLSITASVAALLQLTGSVGWELKKFHNKAREVDKTIKNLLQDVERFDNVLLSMRDTFAQITAQSTGLPGNLWRNVARSLEDGVQVLKALFLKLQGINKDSKFLNSARKQLRLNFAEDDINTYREQITSFRDCLSLSLSTIVVQNQLQTTSAVPDLSQIEDEIRRVANETNKRIERLQESVAPTTVTVLSNLRDCVQSSADVVSSASSLGGRDDATVVARSDFGDCFPPVTSLPMQRWLEGSVVPEDDVVADDDETGSEDELELELATSLLDAAEEKAAIGDKNEEEILLKHCVERSAPYKKKTPGFQLHLSANKRLHQLYRSSYQWSNAQKTWQQVMTLNEQSQGPNHNELCADLLELAELMLHQNQTVECCLYARQALRASRKEHNLHQQGASLRMLLSTCTSDTSDYQAYALMLSKVTKQIGPLATRARALWSFEPDLDGDLGFQKDDIIEVTECIHTLWWTGHLRGKTGTFPSTYVEIVQDGPPTRAQQSVTTPAFNVEPSTSQARMGRTPSPGLVARTQQLELNGNQGSNNNGPYKCSKCPAGFALSVDLKQHMRNTHSLDHSFGSSPSVQAWLGNRAASRQPAVGTRFPVRPTRNVPAPEYV